MSEVEKGPRDGRRLVRVERHIDAPIQSVWEVVTDHRGMNRWLVPGMKVRLEPEGVPAPNGVGAVRVIERAGFKGRERVVTFNPPHSLSYTVVSGIPVKDHLGIVVLKEENGGTHLVWTVRFAPRLWGMGNLMQLVLRNTLSRGLGRLSKMFE